MSEQRTAHTPGPWTLKQTPSGYLYAIANTSNHVIRIESSESDARRIVACVNACEGISTEALEDGVVREMLAVLQALVKASYDSSPAWEMDALWRDAEDVIKRIQGDGRGG